MKRRPQILSCIGYMCGSVLLLWLLYSYTKQSSRIEALQNALQDCISAQTAVPRLKKLYYVGMAGNTQRRDLMEKQLRSTGYPYERYEGVGLRSVAGTKAAWDEMLQRSLLPSAPWREGWIDRLPCWMDIPHFAARADQMVGTTACAINYIGALDRIGKQAIEDSDDAIYLLLEDDCLLLHNWDTKLAAVVASLPPEWDAVRLGYWGKTRQEDVYNSKVFRVNVWWTPPDNAMYTGNHALLLSKKGVFNMLRHWATQKLCWTDTAIDSTTHDLPEGAARLNVFAVQEKLAAEVQVGLSRGDLDGRPEVHHEDEGEITHLP